MWSVMERLTPESAEQLMGAVWGLITSYCFVRIEHEPDQGDLFTRPWDCTTEEIVVWRDSGEFGSVRVGFERDGTDLTMMFPVTTDDFVPSSFTEHCTNFELQGSKISLELQAGVSSHTTRLIFS